MQRRGEPRMSDGGTRIDPFGLWPSARSVIGGLGGREAPRSEKYAFASRPCTATADGVTFLLEFEGLKATSGVLRVMVGAQRESASRGRWVVEERVELVELAAKGGRWTAQYASRPDTLYSVAGQVEGVTDATASALRLDFKGHGGSERFEARLRNTPRHVLEPRGPVLGGLFGRSPSRTAAGSGTGGEPTLAAPVSQMCTTAQMQEPTYESWLSKLATPHQWHRKQWELVYVLRVLESRGCFVAGARGLGFGSGTDCIASYVASQGCDVLATDLSVGDQQSAGWRASGQHAAGLDSMFWPGICSREAFDAHVRFRAVDMRAIPSDLSGYDFCWSACAFEHLGSIRKGLDFVRNSIGTLRPGGVAVHTTEFNLTSNGRTVDHEETVLFRRRDMERLARRLESEGHRVSPFNFHRGGGRLDQHVDVPPFSGGEHLRIALKQFVATSFGLVVVKGSAGVSSARG